MLGDIEINNLISEEKQIDVETIRHAHDDKNFRNRQSHSFKKWEHEFHTGNNNVFRIVINRNKRYESNFSVILQYVDRNKKIYNLRRYNGVHGCHKNIIEKNKVVGFHIHIATERYQQKNLQLEGYAEATDRYTDWKGAFKQMLLDCNFKKNQPSFDSLAGDK